MPGSRPVVPTLPCRRYFAETVGGGLNLVIGPPGQSLLNGTHHLQVSPAPDVSLHKQERNLVVTTIRDFRSQF